VTVTVQIEVVPGRIVEGLQATVVDVLSPLASFTVAKAFGSVWPLTNAPTSAISGTTYIPSVIIIHSLVPLTLMLEHPERSLLLGTTLRSMLSGTVECTR
jgi:hypothetical protein